MNTFANEPARLQLEQERIHSEIVAAAVQHYPVFVESSDNIAGISTELSKAHKVSGDLVGALSTLGGECEILLTAGATWRKEKQKAALALSMHSKIAEILDAPQTLEQCLRSEMFHEAILVVDHFKAMASMYGDIPLVSSVGGELTATLQRMVVQIIGKLSGNLSLSLAIKITTFLRRLGFGEGQLRTLFIEKRDEFVEHLLRDAKAVSDTPFTYIAKATNVVKVHVSDVLSQYNSCFVKSGEGGYHHANAWALSITQRFIAILRENLVHISSGGKLASTAEQLHHCCAALARVGMDMSSIAIPMVRQRIYQLFDSHLQTARQHFRVAMQTHSWVLKGTGKQEAAPTGNAPPPSILRHVPLAYATNAFLSGCNELRKCAAASLAEPCAEASVSFFEDIVQHLRGVHANSSFDASELQAFVAFANVACDAFIPHCSTCFDELFHTELLQGRVSDVVQPLQFVIAQANVKQSTMAHNIAEDRSAPTTASSSHVASRTATPTAGAPPVPLKSKSE